MGYLHRVICHQQHPSERDSRNFYCPKISTQQAHQNKKSRPAQLQDGASFQRRRRPTLPPCGSTIGAAGLNCPVRDGKGWAPECDWQAGKTRSPAGSAPRAPHAGGNAPGKAFRAISTARLHVSVVHLRPIDVLVSDGPPNGSLISGRASRLDAFSAYPNRTWLPGGAPGGTTRAPAVRPARSSRTSAGPPQASRARNR